MHSDSGICLDSDVQSEKRLKYSDIETEIRDTINSNMIEHLGYSPDQNIPKIEMQYYIDSVKNVFHSTQNTFEILQSYSKNKKENPDFTKEQIKGNY